MIEKCGKAELPSQISRETSYLLDSIERLEKQVAELQDRLSNVLRIEPEGPLAKACGGGEEQLVPLAQTMRTYYQRINYTTMKVDSMLALIEL